MDAYALLPTVPVIAGTGEQLPVRDGSLDAITVAQAFHWFDAPVAFVEFARVLRPGGRVALLWNTRDRALPWTDRLWGMVAATEHDAPWGDAEHWHTTALVDTPHFGERHAATFHHAVPGGCVLGRAHGTRARLGSTHGHGFVRGVGTLTRADSSGVGGVRRLPPLERVGGRHRTGGELGAGGRRPAGRRGRGASPRQPAVLQRRGDPRVGAAAPHGVHDPEGLPRARVPLRPRPGLPRWCRGRRGHPHPNDKGGNENAPDFRIQAAEKAGAADKAASPNSPGCLRPSPARRVASGWRPPRRSSPLGCACS